MIPKKAKRMRDVPNTMTITKADVKNAINRKVWVLGNQVLYDLCRKYPLHSRDDAIIAKILLIKG